MLHQTTSLALNHKKSGGLWTPAAGSLFHNSYSRGLYSTSGVKESFAARHTFTRTSVADWFGSDDRSLNPQAAINAVRIDGRGVLIEPSTTNNITSNSLSGFSAGSPGTLPTGMSITVPTGLTRTLSSEVIGGATFLRIRYQGVAGSTAGLSFNLDSGYMAAIQNETGAIQCLFQVINDTGWPSGNALLQEIWAYDAGFTFLSTGSAPASGIYTASDLTSRTLKRLTSTRLFPDATTANVRGSWRSANAINSGTTVDIEFRVALGQLEKVFSNTSPIITSGTTATRSADNLFTTIPSITDFTIAGVVRAPSALSTGVLLGSLRIDGLNYISFRTGNADASQLVIETTVAGASTGSATSLTGAIVAGARVGWSARLATLNLSVSVNGAAVITSAAGSVPGAVTSLYIANRNGALQWNGFTEEIAGWAAGKTDGDMQSYSTAGGIK